jgi:hypothetical protein
MSQSSFSPSQFDKPVDNFNDDVLDLQPQDAQVAMEDIEVVVVDDDIAMEVRAPERKHGRSASAV